MHAECQNHVGVCPFLKDAELHLKCVDFSCYVGSLKTSRQILKEIKLKVAFKKYFWTLQLSGDPLKYERLCTSVTRPRGWLCAMCLSGNQHCQRAGLSLNELHLCSHACVPWGLGWLWAWCYHSGRRCSAPPCALFPADWGARRERRNYQLPTSLWGTLGKRQKGKKGQSEILINVLALTKDKNKVSRLFYYPS